MLSNNIYIYIYIYIFFLNGLQDNNWVGNLEMKPVDTVVFQKRKIMIEGKNDEKDNFEMEILDEDVLDKALTVPKKT